MKIINKTTLNFCVWKINIENYIIILYNIIYKALVCEAIKAMEEMDENN